MTNLPIIDITPIVQGIEAPETSQTLYEAFAEIGFAIVVGHGVPAGTISAMRTAVKQVFDTPRNVLSQTIVEKGNYRGYVPLGYFTPNSGKGEADQYEAWKLHTEIPADDPICQASSLYGPNRWPAIEGDVKTPVLAYWSEMNRVVTTTLRTLYRVLGLDTDLIDVYLDKPLTNMTLLNYPPGRAQAGWGIHPHKDFNLITILAHDPVGGLEVRKRDGTWIQADCPPEGLVMNVGDMLEILSGGRLMSTPHRVVNRSGRARQSFPYFSVPRYDVVVESLLPPLPGHERQPLHVGRASADIWYSNWPDRVAVEPGQELGDFGE